MIRNKKNKILFENFVFTVFYQKLLSTRIYKNKIIAKAQPRLRGQVEVNQPCYYTSISTIARTKVARTRTFLQEQGFQKWFHKVVNTMETCKIKYQSVNQESSCGEDGTSDAFSGEQKCRKELKIMCGYKSNES